MGESMSGRPDEVPIDVNDTELQDVLFNTGELEQIKITEETEGMQAARDLGDKLLADKKEKDNG